MIFTSSRPEMVTAKSLGWKMIITIVVCRDFFLVCYSWQFAHRRVESWKLHSGTSYMVAISIHGPSSNAKAMPDIKHNYLNLHIRTNLKKQVSQQLQPASS